MNSQNKPTTVVSGPSGSLILSVMCACLIFYLTLPTTGLSQPQKNQVTLQLAWKHQFQFAGYYAALHRGYYEEAGLEVTISEGGEGRFAREELLNGRAQYGIAGAELILHRAAGDPFVVMAPIFQHSPSVLVTRADSGISNPQQLIGKRVMMLPGNKDADILAVLLNENISLNSLTRMDQTYNLNDLIEGRTDAVTAYLTNEPWHMERLGVKPYIIRPSTYGVDFYSDCLFTTDQELEKNPQQVKKFLAASLKGWKYAMAHPDEIIELIISHYSVKKSREHLTYEAHAINGIMFPDLIEIGHMNPGRWRHIADTYASLNMLEPDYPLNEFIYNPAPHPDYTWMKWTILILITVTLVFTLIAAFLLHFNKKLQREISVREEAEAAYRESRRELNTLISNLPGIAFRCANDEQWTMNYISNGVRAVTGYLPEDLVNNKNLSFTDLILPKDRKHVWETIQAAVENNLSYEIEYRITTKDRQEKTVLERGTGVPSDADAKNIVFIEGFIMDVTQRVMDEQEKLQLQNQLQQARKMEAIGTLAGGIAHDFNNIMGIILGNTELAIFEIESKDPNNKSQHGPDHPVMPYISKIKNACLRAKEVVRQLLTFARKSNSSRIPVEINAVVTEALQLLRASIPMNIVIHKNLPEKSSIILADPTQLSQIMINLCTNATHAMPNGGELGVSISTVTLNPPHSNLPAEFNELSGGEYAAMEVRDTGHGISKECIDRIYDPYFTTKAINEGSGFGLAVVHGIVKRHKGAVSVESIPGQGTTFTILLPVITQSSIKAETTDETAPSPPLFTLPHKGRHILLVDDEPSIIEVGKDILERTGYRVTAETDALESLKKFQSAPHNFDLLITDMSMPAMSGTQLIAAIREVRPDLPVIVSTGYADNGGEEGGDKLDLDIAAHLSKPHEFDQLITTVRRVLDRK